MSKPRKPTVAALLRQVEKLKRELAKCKPSFADPQSGHDWPLSDGEKRFVSIMRQTKPKYCLPKQKQHPSLTAWAEVPHYVGDGWKPMTGVRRDE